MITKVEFYIPEKKSFRQRLQEVFWKYVGFEWNGCQAPEACPDIQSRQVKALAELVEELEKRVEVLEGLEVQRQRR